MWWSHRSLVKFLHIFRPSCTSSLFCSGYFRDRVSAFAQAALDHNTPILLMAGDDMHAPPHPAFSIEMGSCKLFLPRSICVGLKLWSSWSQVGMTDMHHRVQLLGEMRSCKLLFAWTDLKL
jgi:hypothetical protein